MNTSHSLSDTEVCTNYKLLQKIRVEEAGYFTGSGAVVSAADNSPFIVRLVVRV